ncbi:aminotransferase class V-fold PLP-dependent enzyme [Pontibacillus yanchengensis]|uniref:Aminotransferase V n=1 Tax=Pontibacillus yanchengensis Y32 TaxID=1385514 RepID=A0A0A2TII4_9BACI|nr:aminotransferase class V-fold PLP-dependent enzyme [Pontibacillus yanchengensis]KGP74273.1 aminotransferase V [Pontibacillus yanchengensis Y32]
MASLTYKIAAEENELNQIHELNYQTFVQEIPQHETNSMHALVDKFHDENTYVIAKQDSKVVGMIAVRANRPFSLDGKLDNLNQYLPEDANPCEIRLLSVEKGYRSTRVFYHLCEQLVEFCLEKNYTMALISGTLRQMKLYKRIGFQPFGPRVGSEEAPYQPMYLTKENFEQSSKAFGRLMYPRSKSSKKEKSFLPGPVPMDDSVQEAFTRPAISHRSEAFSSKLQGLQERLCQFTHAHSAQVMVGTGTLANDIVAAQLTQMQGYGVILANGEFGNRLCNHANRFDLDYYSIEKEWNDSITLQEVEYLLHEHPEIKWLWTVHCETSTGYLYDLPGLQMLCQKYDVELCLDACSSVGVVPMDLSNVYLASTVSGKGLASYAGLAVVFHRDNIKPNPAIPQYLDLGNYVEQGSIPYTHSSNLVEALATALTTNYVKDKYQLAFHARSNLKEAGFDVLGGEEYSPGIITIRIPSSHSSKKLGERCKEEGILLSYESSYLLERNWVQMSLMGAQSETRIDEAIKVMAKNYETLLHDA